MKLTIRYLFLTIISLLLFLILLCTFLLHTTSGARLVFYTAKKIVPGTLSVGRIHGSLIGPLKLNHIAYQTPDHQLHIHANQLLFDWRLSDLLARKLTIEQLNIDGLHIHLHAPADTAQSIKPAPLPADIDLTHIMPIRLPLGFTLHNITLDNTIFDDDGTVFTFNQISLNAHSDRDALTGSPELILDRFWVKKGQTTLLTTAQLHTTTPFVFKADMKAETIFEHRPTYKGHISASGSLSDKLHLALTSTEPFAMEAKGEIDHLLYHPTAHMTAHVTDMGYPIADPDYRLTDGRLTLHGPLSDYQLQASTTLLGHFLPHGTVYLNSKGNLYGLQGRLNANILGGSLSAQGKIHWLPDFTWHIKGQTHQINLKQQWSPLPNALTSSAQSKGRYTHFWQLAVNVPTLNGTYNNAPLTGHLYYAFNHHNQTMRTHLNVGNAHIDLNAQYAQQWQAKWDINVPQLGRLLNTADGTLTSKGTITGNRKTPHVKATLHANQLQWQHYRLNTLDQTVDVDLAHGLPFNWRTMIDQFQYKDYRINHIGLEAAGSQAQHHGQLTFISPDMQAHFKLTGQYAGSLWQGQLLQANIKTQQPAANWQLTKPIAIALGKSHLDISPSCLISNQKSRVCVHLTHHSAQAWQGTINISQLPLNTFSAISADHRYNTTGAFNANVAIQRNQDGITTGQGKLTLSKGQLYLKANNQPTALAFDHSQATFHIDKTGLQSALRLNLMHHQFVHVKMDLPGYQGQSWPAPSQPVQGNVTANITDLDHLSALFPNFTQIQGKLNADITVSHQLGNPTITGFTRLQDARVVVVPLGIDIHPINFNMTSTKTGQLDWQSTLTSGPGTITANGQTRIQDTHMTTQCRITGKAFEIIHNDEYQANISPDLRISQTPKRLDINGAITIPSARIYPTNISTTVSLPDETVIIDPNASTQNNIPDLPDLYANIHLILGKQINIDALGLKSNLSGDLKITALPQGEPTAIGHLQLNQGEYNLFGKKLTLNKGRLTFHGSSVSNPNLNIQASKSVQAFEQSSSTGNDNLTVGIHITGTADNPDIKLFSDPAGLDDSNILSYLLLGKPADQISVTDSALLIQALDALHTGKYSTHSITGSLQKTLGLDELSIGQVTEYDPSAGGNVSNTGVVLGKALSPQLYVSYSVGLFAEMNIFRVRYALGRGFSLQATSSSLGSGGDILYSFNIP